MSCFRHTATRIGNNNALVYEGGTNRIAIIIIIYVEQI